MQDYEKLGVFYLGKAYDPAAGRRKDELILYDSKDLVTHAVCFGMTGSGKTGLCTVLLEEAAMDGVPSLVIDPKGDLSNLVLTFPELRAEDFRPWINEDDARRKGLTPEEYAQRQAELWRKGLAEWGQGPERIGRLRAAADIAVYTPGSTAGLPVSVLRSLAAPGGVIREDSELLRERVNTTATALLGLLGIAADPVQSREHILLANLLSHAWRQGQDLDLPGLIHGVQAPPMARIGVLELEAFYPAKERFGLSMALNNLLASPGFEAWTEGAPLDIGSLLYSPEGKPRVSIFSIAHLGDAERMFFVSLLLNETLAWMRTQTGTSSLRAILYMDEIFGYFPPVANPPSKQPLLTLLKQARAFGLGVVLATQNPVDLDYKGLANTGTWFLGRLQTERDRDRVLDGLETATGGGVDRQQMERILAQLSNRIFVMNNVHEDGPVVFETRWAMSYLRGPLTRAQLRSLVGQRPGGAVNADQPQAPGAPAKAQPGTPAADVSAARPVLPPAITQYFAPVRGGRPPEARLVYRPMVYGAAQVSFVESKTGMEHRRDLALLAPLEEGPVAVDWERSVAVDFGVEDLEQEPAAGAGFAPLPGVAVQAKSYEAWKRDLAAWIFANQVFELYRSPSLKLTSQPGETERSFRIRLQQAAREERDQQVEKLRRAYAPKLALLQERIRRAEQAAEREREQAKQQKVQTAISVGATLLGALFGRKAVSAGTVGRAATAARAGSRVIKETQDVARAVETVEHLRQQMADLEAQFELEAKAIELSLQPGEELLETVAIRPKKTGIMIRVVALCWAPHWQSPAGTLQPAFAWTASSKEEVKQCA